MSKLPTVNDMTMEEHVVHALISLTSALLPDTKEKITRVTYALSNIKAAKKKIPKDFRGLQKWNSPIYAETDDVAIRNATSYLLHVHEQIKNNNLLTSEQHLDDARDHLKAVLQRSSSGQA